MNKHELKKRGQVAWHTTLVKQGRLAEAERWALSKRILHHAYKTPAARAADAAAKASGATAAATQPLESTSAAAAANAATSAYGATATGSAAGGAGVSQAANAGNRDQLEPRGEISQLNRLGATAVATDAYVAAIERVVGSTAPDSPHSAASATPHLPASPRGEVEGEMESSQANESNRLANEPLATLKEGGVGQSDLGANGDWPAEAGGVIGVGSRNKFYCDVKVGERWAKCAKGGVALMNGERVKVKLVWVSGDGRDAEYEVVERVEIPGAGLVMTAPPVGFEGGSLRAVVPAQGEVTVDGVLVVTPVATEEEAGAPVAIGAKAEDYLERIRAEAAVWAGAEL